MRLANFWILPHNCSTLKSNSAVQRSPRKKLVSAPYLSYKIKELFKPRLNFFFKQFCFWFPVLPWNTSSSCFVYYTFVHIHVWPGWKGNMTYTLIKVHFEDSRLQHSIVVTRLARESGGPNSILTPWKIKLFSFSFLLFLHVYFNVQRILSVPTSQNTEILCRFPTMNYQMLTHLISL